ncbi:MAG: DUF485 domain-containing protein [Elusimicrobia bacterium]|nr:DUF485 domain-containing protein [Elusimicrobiota bacterium]
MQQPVLAPERPALRSELPALDADFLALLMRRQLTLSVSCAVCFMSLLLGLPLANYFLPELMARRVGGFTLSWLILGVLFFPLVWTISFVFIRRSMALEAAEAAYAKGERP